MQSNYLCLLPMPKQVDIDSWQAITETANKYNERGKLTAMIGWEGNSIPGGANLDGVVLTDSDAATAQKYQPFGLDDRPFPEDLWAWLDKTSATVSARFTAIPTIPIF